MEKMKKYEAAKRIILENVKPLGEEVVTLEDANNRVISEDIYAPFDIPLRNVSAMDGYALRHSDIDNLPCRLEISGEIFPKGEIFKLEKKKAAYVATGAFLPEGADTVIKVEDALIDNGFLVVKDVPDFGQFVNRKASEVKMGEKLISEGERLNYRLLGLLARFGIYQVRVYSKPKIAIISTGNEIVEPFERDEGEKNANLYILKSLLKEEGADVHYLGIVGDDLKAITRIIENCAGEYHIIVTTGGVSAGKKDYIKRALSELRSTVFFTSTNVKPGRPLTFALVKGSLLFGLPGYPSAMLVNAIEFLLPAVRRFQGMKQPDNNYLEVIAAEDFRSRRGKVYFIRVKFKNKDGSIYAYNAGRQLTSNYITTALCDGFIIIPEDKDVLREGERAKAFFFKI